jgi:hypothetical protein
MINRCGVVHCRAADNAEVIPYLFAAEEDSSLQKIEKENYKLSYFEDDGDYNQNDLNSVNSPNLANTPILPNLANTPILPDQVSDFQTLSSHIQNVRQFSLFFLQGNSQVWSHGLLLLHNARIQFDPKNDSRYAIELKKVYTEYIFLFLFFFF